MRRTPFDLPLALFAIAAGVGVWTAYDRAAAWPKLIVILAGIMLYYALVFLPRVIHRRDSEIETTRLIFALAPAFILLYFLLTVDLSYRLGKIPLLDPLMRAVMVFQPRLGLPEMNTNTLGGLMAVLLPLQIQAWLSQRPSRRLMLAGGALILFSLFGLLLSASRAGWLSLAVVSLFWLLRRLFGKGMARTFATIGAFTLILAGAWLLLGDRVVQTVASDRAPIWSTGFQLATDYPFTGLGLANFTMPYSSYTWLTHVPYLTHAHNLYLDVWLETGLLGVFAFVMMIVIAFFAPANTWRAASLAAVSVLLLHGALDDPLFAYGLPGQLFIWLPFVAIARQADTRYLPVKTPLAVAGTVVAVGVFAILVVPPAQSAWQANLGALAQTRIELTDYRYEQWGMQDNLRRSGEIDLEPALVHYRQALALDPSNATANRRLGQIELAMGDYPAATAHLQAAYAATPGFRASRQMWGESLAIAGEQDEAVDLWRSIDASQGQLNQRLDWYQSFIKDEIRAGRIVAVLQRLRASA